MIELLVVIGIILVIAGIALPMLIKAYSYADKSKARADLNTIAICLEAYKQDFGDYPRPVNDVTTYRGARALCQALVAPGGVAADGADGPGFRLRKSAGPDAAMDTPDDVGMGPVKPAYLQMDRFKVAQPDVAGNPNAWVLQNKDGYTILYYVASPKSVDVTLAAGASNGYVGNVSPSVPGFRYSYADNSTYFSAGSTFMQAMLGDVVTVNNKQDAGETFINQPYLLWTPGADGTYGPAAANKAAAQACDDITNITK